MSKIIFNTSISLDGFIAGPNHEVNHLFTWYSSGEVEIPEQNGRIILKVSPESAAYMKPGQTSAQL
jgi:hypothetical protein